MVLGTIDCQDEEKALDAYQKLLDGEGIEIKEGECIFPIMVQLAQIVLGDDKNYLGELTKTGKEIVGI